MSKERRRYGKMRDDQEFVITRERAGRYTISHKGADWRVWRSINGRWYGESGAHPDKMLDEPTLYCIKSSLRLGYLVPCAGAGASVQEHVSPSQAVWEAAMGMRGYAGSPAEREDQLAARRAKAEGGAA